MTTPNDQQNYAAICEKVLGWEKHVCTDCDREIPPTHHFKWFDSGGKYLSHTTLPHFRTDPAAMMQAIEGAWIKLHLIILIETQPGWGSDGGYTVTFRPVVAYGTERLPSDDERAVTATAPTLQEATYLALCAALDLTVEPSGEGAAAWCHW